LLRLPPHHFVRLPPHLPQKLLRLRPCFTAKLSRSSK
jgi:hypothetical protein